MVLSLAQEANAAVTQTVEVVGGIPSCQQVVIVDAQGGSGAVLGLAHDDVGDALFTQIVVDYIILPGIQQDKTVDPAAQVQGFHTVQQFRIVLTGDDGAGSLALIADLADAPDGLQEKVVFKGILVGGGQNDADHFDGLMHRGFLGGHLVAKLSDGFADPFRGFLADGGVVVADPGDGGGGDSGQSGDILDGNSHRYAPYNIIVSIVLPGKWDVNVLRNFSATKKSELHKRKVFACVRKSRKKKGVLVIIRPQTTKHQTNQGGNPYEICMRRLRMGIR